MERISTTEIESVLREIPGIQAVRMVTDSAGKPLEVHIVAGAEKHAKQIVRDIQTVSLAQFGVELDHRIVSVVQFPNGVVRKEPRPTIDGIATEVKGNSVKVAVTLRHGESAAIGEASGPSSREGMARAAAAAAINAVMQLAGAHLIELEYADIRAVGSSEIAVTTLSVLKPRPEMLSGAVVVGGMPQEAVVKAVLQSLNRRLWRAD